MVIGILGWFKGNNFGDQLILRVLQEWIHGRFRDCVILVPFAEPSFSDWKPTGRSLYGGGKESLGKCDAVIWAGGGYLGEYQSTLPAGLRHPLRKIRRLVVIARATRKFMDYSRTASWLSRRKIPYAVLGIGVGPVTTFLSRRALRGLFSKSEFVTTRDSESADWARKITPSLNPVVTTDLVLDLAEKKSRRSPGKIKEVAVNMDMTSLREMGAGSVRRIFGFFAVKGLKVSVVASDLSGEREKLRDKLFSMLPAWLGKKARFIPYQNTEALLRGIRGKYDLVLTTKLHVGIAAYALGKIPVSIAAHVKTRRFYRQAGLEDFYFNCDSQSVERALAKMEDIFRYPLKAWKILDGSRAKLRGFSAVNREYLYRFLDEISSRTVL